MKTLKELHTELVRKQGYYCTQVEKSGNKTGFACGKLCGLRDAYFVTAALVAELVGVVEQARDEVDTRGTYSHRDITSYRAYARILGDDNGQ